ncbi:MAG: hypothetical protein HOO96_33115 [Polyangiaceae bacterium]|nr:hypothetical protein [Polyangiaceae bacterium]
MEKSEIGRALELQAQSYAFVRWLGDNKADVLTTLTEDHGDRPPREVMAEWLRTSGSLLGYTRRLREEDQLAFANLFVSYLEISFDLLDHGRRIESSPCGCYCSMCVSITSSSRMVPKKPGSADKERATRALEAELQAVAGAAGKTLTKAQIKALLENPDLREPLAIAAWMSAVFRRMRGDFVGTEALVLWRWFAWKPEGSPKHGFAITEAAVTSAQAQVKEGVERALATETA